MVAIDDAPDISYLHKVCNYQLQQYIKTNKAQIIGKKIKL